MQEASDDLQGRQADVFDYICERWASGEFPCTTAELQDVAKCNASKVNRALRALEKKDLVRQEGQLEPLVSGGRPQLLWVPNTPSLENGETRETTPTNGLAHDKRRGCLHISPCSPTSGGGVAEGFLPPSAGTPVELHRNGAWSNGWVIADASNPGNVRAAKLGSPSVTIGNLRWDLDVRLCQSSPFKAESTNPSDLFDF